MLKIYLFTGVTCTECTGYRGWRLEAGFISGDLFGSIFEELLVDGKLAGQINTSMDNFRSEVR